MWFIGNAAGAIMFSSWNYVFVIDARAADPQRHGARVT